MGKIEECINKVRSAVYGRDVREAIAGGIEQLYLDAAANVKMEVAAARGSYKTLGERLDADAVLAEELKNKTAEIQNRIIVAAEIPETLEEGQICIVYEA